MFSIGGNFRIGGPPRKPKKTNTGDNGDAECVDTIPFASAGETKQHAAQEEKNAAGCGTYVVQLKCGREGEQPKNQETDQEDVHQSGTSEDEEKIIQERQKRGD